MTKQNKPLVIRASLLKKIHFIDWFALIKVGLWAILCAGLIVILILLFAERATVFGAQHQAVNIGTGTYTTVNDIRNAIGTGTIYGSDLVLAYSTLLTWANFPLIDFSLMLFVPNTGIPTTLAPADAWTIRWNNVSLAYSYFFITVIIAFVGLLMLVFDIISTQLRNRKNKKFGIIPYPVKIFNYNQFYLKTLTEFILNLAMVFAFFNFLSTLVVLAYWSFLYVSKYIIYLGSMKKITLKTDKLQLEKKDIAYLICIMVFQNAYTIIKSIFVNTLGVNLDLIVSIIFPIGTVTIIIALFIKNLLDSKISSAARKIKNVQTNIDAIRLFVNIRHEQVFDDYNFISIIPSSVKVRLTNKSSDREQAYKDLLKLGEIAELIETKFIKKEKDKNYLLYVAYYVCQNQTELSTFEANLHKLLNE